MSEKLLPCPLCGGCPVLTEAMTEHWVSCGTCGASGGMHGRLKLAVEAWNRRTPAPEGEAVAWRWVPTIKGRKEPWMTGDATPWVYHTGAQKPDFPHCRSGEIQDLQPLYASPVVPVGVSEAAQRLLDYADARKATFNRDDMRAVADAILKATDTGREA